MSQSSEQRESDPKIKRLIAFIGFILIIVGQFLIFAVPAVDDQLPPPTIFFSIAGLLILLLAFLIRPSPSSQARFEKAPSSQPVVWIIIAVIFSILATISMQLFMKHNQAVYAPVLITWFAGGACYVFAFQSRTLTFARLKNWFIKHRTEIFIVSGITLFAAILRFYQLGVHPSIIDGDEGLLGMFAQSSQSGKYANPFALWENFGAFYLQAVYLCIRIFGNTSFALRVLPAVSGTLAIPSLYLLSRQIAGRRVAILSVFLLAISHTHIHFSRIGSVGYIHSTWLVPLELFLLLAGLEKRKTWMTAAGGALLAIHFSVYLTSQVIVGLVIAFMLIALIFMRQWFLSVIKQAGAFWGGFAMMILPELIYILQYPNEFFNRLNQDGVFHTNWLAETIAKTGQSSFQVLAGRVAHAFLSLIYYPAISFYGSKIPMLTLFAAAFFLIGLGIALLRVRKTGMLLLNGYFWAPTLAIGIFAIPPEADAYRMLVTLPPVFLLAAIGIDEFLELMGVGWQRARNSYIFIASGVLIALTAFNLWTYYGDFVGQCRYGGDLTSRFASTLGTFTHSVEKGSQVHLLSDEIFFYGSHASATYLSGQRKITNVPEPVESWQGVSGDVVIASPNRINELETWMYTHSGGQKYFIFDCDKLILLAYRLP